MIAASVNAAAGECVAPVVPPLFRPGRPQVGPPGVYQDAREGGAMEGHQGQVDGGH